MSEETIPELREARDQAVTDAKAERSSRIKAEGKVRQLEAREAFDAAGYEKGHGELFVAVNPEAEFTAEAIKAFVDENNLPARASSETSETKEESEQESGGEGKEQGEATKETKLGDMGGGGSGAGGGGQQSTADDLLTTQEWADLKKSNPGAAEKAVKEGRVKLRTDNPFGVKV